MRRVFKEFYLGWFYKALLEVEEIRSHGIRFIENINCGAKEILSQIEKFNNEFEVLEDK